VESVRKGFIFSFDAIVALVLVMVLAGTVVTQQQALEDKGWAYESLHDKVTDRALIAMYQGTPNNEAIGGEAEFGECYKIFILDPESGGLNGPSVSQESTFCEDAK